MGQTVQLGFIVPITNWGQCKPVTVIKYLGKDCQYVWTLKLTFGALHDVIYIVTEKQLSLIILPWLSVTLNDSQWLWKLFTGCWSFHTEWWEPMNSKSRAMQIGLETPWKVASQDARRAWDVQTEYCMAHRYCTSTIQVWYSKKGTCVNCKTASGGVVAKPS